jgi:hypothetical protein
MPIHDPNRVPTALALIAPAAATVRETTQKLAPIAKALVAGASVAIAVAIPLVGNGLSTGEALTIVGAFLAGAFPTWVVPNKR